MTADEHAARQEARRLEAENPLWIVVFGVYSGEFVCFPRFGLDGGSIVAAKDPGTLPPRMRKAENSRLTTSMRTARYQPARSSSSSGTETHP